jgi:hypothetical protein
MANSMKLKIINNFSMKTPFNVAYMDFYAQRQLNTINYVSPNSMAALSKCC